MSKDLHITYAFLQQALNVGILLTPDNVKILASLQSVEPDEEAEYESEERAYDQKPALKFQPSAVHWQCEGRERDEESDEHEDGVDHTR